jgi:sialic acid synthase SpsE
MSIQINPDKTYFIADIAANHDGSLERACELIELAAKAGANAAKFQNFKAETIVSDIGFNQLGKRLSHQASWNKSVFEVYKKAEVPLDWTDTLIAACKYNGIDYFTAPYDIDFIEYFSKRISIFKIGSGDINWKEAIQKIASKAELVILATGASEIQEVLNAVSWIEEFGTPYVLMQCNTNYTASEENYSFLNLRVLEDYKYRFPKAILGLSDHTPGHVSVIGAVALGARFIEKHFTDDNNREGPDHKFSLNPLDWREMVTATRILEASLGDGKKTVEENEQESRIIQRRCLRFARDLPTGTVLTDKDLVALRPAPLESISPDLIGMYVGKRINSSVTKEQILTNELFKA